MTGGYVAFDARISFQIAVSDLDDDADELKAGMSDALTSVLKANLGAQAVVVGELTSTEHPEPSQP